MEQSLIGVSMKKYQINPRNIVHSKTRGVIDLMTLPPCDIQAFSRAKCFQEADSLRIRNEK